MRKKEVPNPGRRSRRVSESNGRIQRDKGRKGKTEVRDLNRLQIAIHLGLLSKV